MTKAEQMQFAAMAKIATRLAEAMNVASAEIEDEDGNIQATVLMGGLGLFLARMFVGIGLGEAARSENVAENVMRLARANIRSELGSYALMLAEADGEA